MDEVIIKKLLEKKEYYNYLKENSEWVKLLKRNNYRYREFESFIKKKYKIRTQDKVKNTLNKMSLISDIIGNLK